MELLEPVKDLLLRSWNFFLNFLAAVVIFVIGWIIAKIIKSLVIKVLKTLRVDSIAEQAKITDFLSKGGISNSLSDIFGIVIYWIILLGVLISSLNILSLTGVSSLLDKIVGYLPNVIGALIILILGTFLSAFVASVVRATAVNVGLNQANLLSKTAQGVIIAFTIIITLEELRIGAVLASAMNIVLATLGLGIALAFGLGCKDIAARFVSDIVDKMKSKK